MSDHIRGTAREFGGRAQETVGNLAGDTKRQAQGLYDLAAGHAQQTAGQLSDMITPQPLASALVALGVGTVLGSLTS